MVLFILSIVIMMNTISNYTAISDKGSIKLFLEVKYVLDYMQFIWVKQLWSEFFSDLTVFCNQNINICI